MHLSGLLPCVLVFYLCASLKSCLLLHDDLQHKLKWFLKPHLWHFLPNAGQSLNWCSSVALTAHFAVSGTLATHSAWTAGLGTFLTVTLECLDHIYSHWLCNSSIQLVVVEIFYSHFMLFSAYWRNAWYATSSRHCFFDRTNFFTLKCLVVWNKSSVLRTSFSFGRVLASFNEILDSLVKLVSWLIVALFDVGL